MMTTTQIENPYVGPRTFTREEGHLFFGREREARQLLSRVISERLVLFYAQSGAGKSSLINTRLIPQLQEAGYNVFPIGRVSGELPEGVSQVDNIFVFNLMLSLDQANADPNGFAQDVSLSQFLAELIRRNPFLEWLTDGKIVADADDEEFPHVLIIDQFEEIVTAHPGRWQEREGFFRQLNQAMIDDPLLWVVLTLREDYVAVVEPYAYLLTDKMRARFQMQRMGYQAAIEAVKKPAEQSGRPFASDVAETLVDNLRKIRIPGQTASQLGQFLEPMQLQVVCYQLWDNLGEWPVSEITQQNLRELGDVDQVLTRYYTETLEKVLRQTETSERQLRSWFNNKLITSARTRGLVHRGEKETGGLPNKTIDILNGAYIIRTNTRGNDTWYELAHDRLIEPILEANRRWQEEQPLFLAAQAWWITGQGRKNLYGDTQLEEALAYATVNSGDLSEKEEAFLKASQKQAAEIKRRRVRLSLLGLIILFMVLIVLLLQQKQIADAQRAAAKVAERQSRIFLAQSLAALAPRIIERTNDTELAALLTIEALRLNRNERGHVQELIDSSLRKILSAPYFNTTLTGHVHEVTAIAFSPDGKTLASGSYDKTVRLWRLDEPTVPSIILDGHQEEVTSVAFSPDGSLLASGSRDKTVCLWSFKASPPFCEPLNGHKSDVLAVTFAPDGQTLASAGGQGIHLWDLHNLSAPPTILEDSQNSVNSIMFNPLDGAILASGNTDGTIRLWDTHTRQQRGQPLIGHALSVLSVAFSPDGQTLASGSGDKTIRLWNVKTGQSLGVVLSGHENKVRSVTFSPDGETLASSGDDLIIRLWQWREATLTSKILIGHRDWIRAVAFSPDGLTLASGSRDDTIRLWDMSPPRGRPIPLVNPEPRRVWSIAFSPDEFGLVASGSEDGIVRLWNMRAPAESPISLTEHSRRVNTVTFHPREPLLAAGGDDNIVSLWNVQSSTILAITFTGHTSGVNTVAFHPSEPLLASGSDDKTIRLWDIRDPTASPLVLTGHTSSVNSVTIHPNEPILVSGSDDTTVRLWNINNPTGPPTILTGHEDKVRTVALSPDGQLLASGGNDEVILLWDLQNPNIPIAHRMSIAGFRISSIAFSTDRSEPVLAAVGENNFIYMWDLHNLTAPPTILTDHNDWINTLAFSPNGLTLASGGYDQSIYLWIPQIDRLVNDACTKVKRNLTKEEWKRYITIETYKQSCPNLPIHP